MIWRLLLSFVVGLAPVVFAQYTDNTIVSNGPYKPAGVAVDNANTPNLYFADYLAYRIRMLSGSSVTPVVGTGTAGYSPDGTSAASAQIGNVTDIAMDHANNLYLADPDNLLIRMVQGGHISTIAGTYDVANMRGVFGNSGDGGSARSATLRTAKGIVVDTSGNVYFGDENRIRKVSNGFISLVAGGGPPDGTLATNISIQSYLHSQAGMGGGIVVDPNFNVYVSDQNQNRVYKIATNGAVSTVAGTGASGYNGDGIPATSARLDSPTGLALDTAGSLYIADTNNNRIRKVSNGMITTVAGNGVCCYNGDNQLATNANLSAPSGVAVDTSGNIYIADTNNNSVRLVTAATGKISTLAGTLGNGGTGDGGPAANAKLGSPMGIALDAARNVYIADRDNCRVRMVSAANQVITTVAGSPEVGTSPTCGNSGDNPVAALSAKMGAVYGIWMNSTGTSYYIADGSNNRIRMVLNGTMTTAAGGATVCAQPADSVGDGCPPTQATLNTPEGVAVDISGNLYIVDTNNFRVRKVANGTINNFAGNGLASYSGDDGPAASAQINTPAALAIDSSGNLYMSDPVSNRIRKISSDGTISWFAGGGTQTGDGVAPKSALLSGPGAIALDTAQNLYIVDRISGHLRKISNNQINTIANVSAQGTTLYPSGVVLDGENRIFLSDPNNNGIIRLLTPNNLANLSISKTHIGNFSQGQSGATYTITVTNGGAPAAATSGTVTVTDNIPSGLTLVSMSGAGWSCPSNICTRSDSLAAGGSYPAITVIVNVAANAPSPVTNTATVSGGGSPPASSNNLTNIDTKYQLTMIVSPAGAAASISPSSGFYSPNTSFTLQETPNTGFQFTGWTGVSSQTSLTLSAPSTTVTANFKTACTYTLASPTAVPVGAGAGSGSEGITVTAGCSYSVAQSSLPSWLHATGNSGSIAYSYDANTGTSQRTGTITVLDGYGFLTGQLFTVTQAGATCTGLTLSPSIAFGVQGGTGTATFSPTCALPSSWTASANASWVHVPASGTSSSITVTADDNSASNSNRSATITVNTASGTFTIAVTQSACNFGIGTGSTSIASAGFLSAGGSGSITVNVLPGQPAVCNFTPWTATTPPANPSWISLQTSTGFGAGSVSYTIAPNTNNPSKRTGTVFVAGLAYTINQAADITQNYKCSQPPPPTFSATPTMIRVEGQTELTGDMVFRTCDNAAPGGVTGDIVVTYNTTITNRRLSTDASGQTIDAVLRLNDNQAPVLNTNIFLGVVAGPNSIRFPKVPLAGSGGGFNNDWRITNVRVDATQLATLSKSNPTQVIGSIAFAAPVEISVVNPSQVVANVPKAANVPLPSLMFSSPGSITTTSVPLTFTEGWSNAFRNFAAETGSLYTSLSGGTEIGYPTNATRLLAKVTGVPPGVTIYAPLVQASGPNARLVSADPTGAGGFPQLGTTPYSGTYQLVDQSGTMTWEVIDSDPNTSQTFTFNVMISNPGNASLSGLAFSGSLAPQLAAGGPSSTAPVPRFVSTPQTPASLSILPQTSGLNVSSLSFGKEAPDQRSPRRLAALGVHEAAQTLGTNTVGAQLNNGAQGSPPAMGGKGIISFPPGYVATSCTPAATCQPHGNSCGADFPSMPYAERMLMTCSAYNTGPTSGNQFNGSVTSDSGNMEVSTSSFSNPLPVPYISIKTPPDGSQIPGGPVIIRGLAIPTDASNAFMMMQLTVDDVLTDSPLLQKSNWTIDDLDCSSVSQYSLCPKAGYEFPWNLATGGKHNVCVIVTDSSSTTSRACVNLTVTPTISGRVTINGNPLSGVLVSLSGAQTLSTTTDSSGNYSFPGLALNAGYTVTPTLQGYTFTPPSQAINSITSDQVLNFTAVTAATQYQLTTAASPVNGGTVTASPTSSNGLYNSGTTVQLTAIPAQGYLFSGWGGDLAGIIADPASITMNSAHSVTANFILVNPAKFVAVTPCRIADTRNATGPFGGPAITGQTSRDFVIPNSACGIPTTAAAYSINVTVVPHGFLGYLTVYPTGQSLPLASTLNSYDGRVKANAAIVSAGTGGAICRFRDRHNRRHPGYQRVFRDVRQFRLVVLPPDTLPCRGHPLCQRAAGRTVHPGEP